MSLSDGFIGAIGNTPLIRLEHLSDETGCEILGKAEFMNPGGSVKDRAAKWIILDAETVSYTHLQPCNWGVCGALAGVIQSAIC